MTSTVNLQEIQHFSKDSAHWWDPNGPFKPLHKLNPARMKYIRDQICSHYDLHQNSLKPFTELKILDVGCGGGLVCEPLARLGANVTGLDADPNAIEAAKLHAEDSHLKIDYRCKDLADIKNQFDVVLALEVIEHVDDISLFIEQCISILKPDGMMILSTLNRTAKSYALGIVAAEYLLRWVPQGTHDWNKFVKPSELVKIVTEHGLNATDITGLVFEPLKNDFKLSKTNLDVNYFMSLSRTFK